MKTPRRPLLLAAVAALALSAALSGCGFMASRDTAQEGVNRFHRRMNEAKFEEIYDLAATRLQTAETKEQFVARMEPIHRRLGTYVNGSEKNWNIDARPGGTTVVLTFKSRYEHGPADETFKFLVKDGKAWLEEYRVGTDASGTPAP